MIITPAKFEDMMTEAKTSSEAMNVILETLKSLGYEAGIYAYLYKHMERDFLGKQ